MKARLEEKKIILIATPSPTRLNWFESQVKKHLPQVTIYSSSDGIDAASKLQNSPPNVVITEVELPKTLPLKLVEHTINSKATQGTAVIISGHLPEEGQFLDEMVTGKVQYLTTDQDEQEFARSLVKALNFSSHQKEAEFYVRFLAPGDVLLKEGDKADCVYFVKRGQLKAFKKADNDDITLGSIEVGEFVGEMGYINAEPRSASVVATADCELIEVPIGTFESVLFKRPAWSKALMLTLAKRVKAANSARRHDF